MHFESNYSVVLMIFILLYVGMNNNDRPEGNFNRNDRHRVNMNQRGPRHWKDNDDGAPLTKRKNRSFDGSKDNRNRYI